VIKTLEVIASFPDNEHVSYTMLVDVKGVGVGKTTIKK
jgi:hypothetical protein